MKNAKRALAVVALAAAPLLGTGVVAQAADTPPSGRQTLDLLNSNVSKEIPGALKKFRIFTEDEDEEDGGPVSSAPSADLLK
ncbi:hypothetical protein ACFW6F_22000 [Streptomyces sp. NPDC058746]|uniref:hypothetical protein n=1 Tax=Streptomyces sp. NPDC058746 TaxID=3346622 RepID=UPI00368AD8C6